MHQIIGLKQLRENVAEYARQVQKGKSFIVVKQSKPLFKISPLDEIPEVNEPYHDPNYKTIIDFTKIKPGGVPIEEVVKALDELKKDGQNPKGNRKTLKRA